MGKINLLPKSIYELIAAGEVVERPASVVKELVENSIDAGARKIIVEIQNGGIRYMRITDDGCGIEREDIRAAFIAHATSKIKSADDLYAIGTLGFRGEALASVAAVGRVEVLTKTAGSTLGIRYVISGGEELELTDAGCPTGTTIVIRDLFYNTPARMKFLKKDVTEGSYVSDTVTKAALSHPEVSFRLIKDNKQTLFTPGDGKLISAVREVYGRDFAAGLIPAEGEMQGVAVRGYISKPVFSRPNRQMQHTFVNGRYVKIPLAATALDNAYKNTVMVGKYPCCVLFVTMDPRMVDVNVHPAKTQVRFAREKDVYDAIYFAALTALQQKDAPVETTLRAAAPKLPQQPFVPRDRRESAPDPQPRQMRMSVSADAPAEPLLSDIYGIDLKDAAPPVLRDTSSVFESDPVSDEDDVLNMRPAQQPRPAPFVPAAAEEVRPAETPGDAPAADAETGDPAAPLLAPFRLIGEAFSTYILIQQNKKLIFIDKHAAHERMLFNALKNNDRPAGAQMLLSPVTVMLPVRDYHAVLENLDVFDRAGYVVEDFGEGAVRVRGCPAQLSDADVTELIAEAANAMAAGAKEPETEKLDRLLSTTACRAAVKAGDALSDAETEDFVRRVLTDDNVRYCPHGRPVLFELSENELKRLFGREG